MFIHFLMVSKGVSFPSDIFPASLNMPGFPTRKQKHNSERKVGDIQEAAWWILETVTKKTDQKVLKLVFNGVQILMFP